jgi:hypothetical protein
MVARLGRKSIRLSAAVRAGERATFALRFPAQKPEGTAGYLVARAAEKRYAIPIDSVERVVAARQSMRVYSAGGKTIRVSRIPEAKSVSAGILVCAGAKRAVLLFDAVEGEEQLAPTDASVTLIDVPSLLEKLPIGARKKPKRPGKAHARKR